MKKPDLSKKALYNPLDKDFTLVWFDDKNTPHTLIVSARNLTYFPHYQFDFVKKHLIDFICNERKVNTTHPDEVENIKKEIEI